MTTSKEPILFWIQGVCVGIALAGRGYRRGNLTVDGAIAGSIVASLLIGATGYRGYLLFIFYLLGSQATKYRKNVKQAYDATVEADDKKNQSSTRRNAYQVLACSIVAVFLSLWQAYQFSHDDQDHAAKIASTAMKPIDFTFHPAESCFSAAVLSHHATCLADTLASELGMATKRVLRGNSNLSSATERFLRQPVLITQPWKCVPIGTNGGVSVLGTCYSGLGGLIMGFCFILADRLSGYGPPQYYFHLYGDVVQLLLFSTVMGLAGSAIDSILGATVQCTYFDATTAKVYHHISLSTGMEKGASQKQYVHVSGKDWLSNVQVNFVSVCIATYAGGWVVAPWWFRP
jgi:uncharacterized membrane protein